MPADQQTGFEERSFSASDGLMLSARDYGHGASGTADRLPVVCLPGLSRNARDFHQLALLLSRDPLHPRRVVVLDYRGRGKSCWDANPANYTVAIETADVMTACAALDIARALFVGTSRGGLILHVLAVLRPTLLAGVVLNDIGPVIEIAGLAEIKTYLLAASTPASWQDAAAMLKKTHGAAFPAFSDQDWADMAEAIFTVKDGSIVADFDPALLEPLKTMTLDAPLPDLWAQFDALTTVPAMAIRGEYSRLLSPETFTAMQNRHPQFVAYVAKGQGHAPILHVAEIALELTKFFNTIG